ncbi:MAG: acyl-CoA dehydrogenase family protein [Aestuariibacter sp.]
MADKNSASDANHAETHQVFNQPTPLEHYNAYRSDQVLQYWAQQFGGNWGQALLTDFGKQIGGPLLKAGFDANKFKPEFAPHDRFGHRIDEVSYHPAYHQIMQHAICNGHHSLPWSSDDNGRHVVRAAMAYLHTQADPGSGCPLTMTFASIPALQQQPALADYWLPKVLSNHYDPENKPYFEKQGVTIGMAMTEKQGGSDVRANTTTAQFLQDHKYGAVYELVGHKWFCSAPMCDAFLMLAQTESGLSCFLVPRWREDGSKNPIHIQRLKDKVGNVSNASSEIELRGAQGWIVGEPGRGVKTILQMVALTRYDCMLGSSALMAQAVRQAIHHTSGRRAFGKNLHEQLIMQNVLADLALEAEAALAISMRIAKALENLENPIENSVVRLGTAIGKYWICKRTPQFTYEAMECIGGVAVVKDNVLARLYAEAPINAIWEGSGNIQCLDIMRAIVKEPDDAKHFIDELLKCAQSSSELLSYVESLSIQINDVSNFEAHARQLTEKLAIAWQAATLLRYGDNKVANTYIANRLVNRFNMYGCLTPESPLSFLIQRYLPEI